MRDLYFKIRMLKDRMVGGLERALCRYLNEELLGQGGAQH